MVRDLMLPPPLLMRWLRSDEYLIYRRPSTGCAGGELYLLIFEGHSSSGARNMDAPPAVTMAISPCARGMKIEILKSARQAREGVSFVIKVFCYGSCEGIPNRLSPNVRNDPIWNLQLVCLIFAAELRILLDRSLLRYSFVSTGP